MASQVPTRCQRRNIFAETRVFPLHRGHRSNHRLRHRDHLQQAGARDAAQVKTCRP